MINYVKYYVNISKFTSPSATFLKKERYKKEISLIAFDETHFN